MNHPVCSDLRVSDWSSLPDIDRGCDRSWVPLPFIHDTPLPSSKSMFVTSRETALAQPVDPLSFVTSMRTFWNRFEIESTSPNCFPMSPKSIPLVIFTFTILYLTLWVTKAVSYGRTWWCCCSTSWKTFAAKPGCHIASGSPAESEVESQCVDSASVATTPEWWRLLPRSRHFACYSQKTYSFGSCSATYWARGICCWGPYPVNQKTQKVFCASCWRITCCC